MTHAERVLNLLSDGEPHGHMEGYRLGVMLHSRVSDLRRQGYRIDCWREGDLYLYQLKEVPQAAAGLMGDAAAPLPMGPPESESNAPPPGAAEAAPAAVTSSPGEPVLLRLWETAA